MHQELPHALDAKARVLGTNRFAIVAMARAKFKSTTENQSDMNLCSKFFKCQNRDGYRVLQCINGQIQNLPGVESEAHFIEVSLKRLCARLSDRRGVPLHVKMRRSTCRSCDAGLRALRKIRTSIGSRARNETLPESLVDSTSLKKCRSYCGRANDHAEA